MAGWRWSSSWMGLAVFAIGCGGMSRHDLGNSAAGSASVGEGGSNASGGAGQGASAASGAAGAAPAMRVDSFETADAFVSIGLWMGFPNDTVPIGTPPTPHDGSALHLVGETDASGLDVFFHTGVPVERVWSGVSFWTQSDRPGSKLTVAIAGPEPSYFADRALGVAWPEQVVTPTRDWREVAVDFAKLGIGPDHLSPHSESFGAVHFIIEPQTKYDLWIDDFAGQPLYR